MRDAFGSGRNGEALKLQGEVNEIVEAMVEVGVFNAVKYAMTLRGVDCGSCRGPFKPLMDAAKVRVQAVLEKNLGEALL
jgi:N-acetylneuraminate lyase